MCGTVPGPVAVIRASHRGVHKTRPVKPVPNLLKLLHEIGLTIDRSQHARSAVQAIHPTVRGPRLRKHSNVAAVGARCGRSTLAVQVWTNALARRCNLIQRDTAEVGTKSVTQPRHCPHRVMDEILMVDTLPRHVPAAPLRIEEVPEPHQAALGGARD
jgi:hypothetical protein